MLNFLHRRDLLKLAGLTGLGLSGFEVSPAAAQSTVPVQSVKGANIFDRKKGAQTCSVGRSRKCIFPLGNGKRR